MYAASGINWGAYRDARERKDIYWYWSVLKKYITYVFSSYKGKNLKGCKQYFIEFLYLFWSQVFFLSLPKTAVIQLSHALISSEGSIFLLVAKHILCIVL